jgi:hypothetical protein
MLVKNLDFLSKSFKTPPHLPNALEMLCLASRWAVAVVELVEAQIKLHRIQNLLHQQVKPQ